MKPFSRWCGFAVFAAMLVVFVNIPAFADTYHIADFTGQMGSSPNVKAPFSGNGFSGGGPVTGSFVYDDQMIPGAGSGFVNVFFSTFPDIGQIPAATAFTINLGTTPLTFTFADAMPGDPPGIIPSSAAIQYNNGVFNGFFFEADFAFLGNPYRLDVQGGTWFIHPIVNGFPTFTNTVSGTLNFNLTNVQSFTPVPVPPTMLLLGSGLLGLAGWRRFRKN